MCRCKNCDEAAFVKGDAPAPPSPSEREASAGDEVPLGAGDEEAQREGVEGADRGGNAGRTGELEAASDSATEGAMAALAAAGMGHTPPASSVASCSVRRS